MIDIYSKLDCTWCKAAKDLLDVNNIEYNEYVIGRDLTREEFLEKFPNAKSVPHILVDNNFIGGYDKLLEHVSKKDN